MSERAAVRSARRRVGVLLGAVSAAATLLGAAVEPSHAVQPGRAGLVAVTDYASPEGCGPDAPADGGCPFSQVTLIDPRTGIKRTLPCEPQPVIACGDHTPTWSPSGESLFFTRDNNLWTAPAGSGPQRLFLSSPRRVAVGASFAPGGKRFVFAGLTDNPLRDAVFVTRRDGGGVRRLTPRVGKEPSWSARNLVAFEGTSRGRPAVFTVRPDGRLLRRVARRAGQPDWSPSGKLLAASSSSNDGRRRRIVVRPGGRVRTVTRGRDDQSPAWSPDGRWLAFRRGPGVYVVRMRQRGWAPVKDSLKRLCRVCASPSWQPL